MIDIPAEAIAALQEGNTWKNYVVEVYDNNGVLEHTIDNNNIVYESVTFGERMASGDMLKFGLCEGSTFEFQYFDFPNIRGKRIYVELEVEYEGDYHILHNEKIPIGWFDVDKCAREASTGIFKATCYNKLKSEYLDSNASAQITKILEEREEGNINVSLFYILNKCLSDYSIYKKDKTTTQIKRHSKITNTTSISTTDNVYTLNVTYCDVTLDTNGDNDDYFEFVYLQKASEYIKKIKTEFLDKIGSLKSKNVIFEGKYMSIENLFSLYPDADYEPSRFRTLASAINGAMYLGQNSLPFDINSTDMVYISQLDKNYTTNPHRKDIKSARIRIPTKMTISSYIVEYNFDEVFEEYDFVEVYKLNLSDVEKKQFKYIQSDFFKNATLRQLQSAVFELDAKFGRLDRKTDVFSGVELNGSRLYPQDTLYPSNLLYPDGAAESPRKSMYSQLFTDNVGTQKFRNLIVTYKTLDSEDKEIDKTVSTTINADGTQDYEMDNWLFKNMVWTDSDITSYSNHFVQLVRNVTWFPFDMWCVGLPHLETGDELEITTEDGTYTTYILERTLTGVQNLQDTFRNGILDIF